MTEPTILQFSSRAEWEEWLEANHYTSPGVWLRLGRKGSDAEQGDFGPLVCLGVPFVEKANNPNF